MKRLAITLVVLLGTGWTINSAGAEDHFVHRFQRQQLTNVYYSEGAGFGDLSGDGIVDIVHGPYWFEGPDFQRRHEIYPAKAQPRQGYADNFFSWVYDFDGDKRQDVLVVGFPGTPAFIYQNPSAQGFSKPWPRHQILDWVSNESPQFTDLTGDGRPELVCTRDGHFGYATFEPQAALGEWKFNKISAQIASKRFGHGLGVGDVNGDGRADVLIKDGWFEQPAALTSGTLWKFHPFPFAPQGGADMFAYDVDGDGDQDVITSLQAHAYGLAWFEQFRHEGQIRFRRHLIMGDKVSDNRYGVLFTELHSLKLVDMDGDGLKDIVTGKTYWSHHTKSPMWDAGAVVYWFRLTRTKQGVDWVPYRADTESGIGRQVSVGDFNGDKLPDIVVGGMKGCHVLLHHKEAVDEARWHTAQPTLRKELKDGLSPHQAARHMTVPAGFRVQLAAGEPQIHQPVAMALDHRGRLWVAEAYTYPRRAPEGQGKDKIIILADSDGDGTLDSRKVFIEGLNLVSGMEVGFGGVWVGAAPYLMFIPDRDGDDQPDDKPQILLDGFGYEDTHETLNGFIWGPDGWLYGCHGVFTHSKVGRPGASADQRTALNASVWRYHPQRHEFEVFAYGTSNPWGVDFNDHGHAFATACVIPHLWHVIQGARYQRQGGRHFSSHIYEDIKTIADHSHFVGDIRDHAWWGHEPNVPASTSAAGGGHAHCGAMIYLGDNWPSQYRNQIFMNNIHGNRVNNDLLVRHRSGYTGKHGKDLLLANDRWFRGINLRYGPDGSVYLIDWYDKNACHRTNPEVWDRTNGRVYRIVYGNPRAQSVNLAELDNQQLVQLHSHRNDWYVRTARRILQHRGKSPDVRSALSQLLSSSQDVKIRLRALWTLHALGGLDETLAVALLEDADEHVRSWAIQLQLEDRQASPAAIAKMASMAREDSSPLVRLYLASALQRLPLKQRWEIAEGLASRKEDANDQNLPLMLWYGVEPLVPVEPERAMELGRTANLEKIRRFIARRAAADERTRNVVVAAIGKTDQPKSQSILLEELLQALEGQVDVPMPPTWKEIYERIRKSKDPQIQERADQIAVALGDVRVMAKMRDVLVDSNVDMHKRQQALAVLVRANDQRSVAAYLAVLERPQLRAAAIRALSAFGGEQISSAILGVYDKLTEAEKRDAIATLTARPDAALMLLDAIDKERVARKDLHAYNIRQLLSFKNERLNGRIKDVWGEIRESSADKQTQINKWKAALPAQKLQQADVGNGRRVFNKSCATCHTLFGVGEKIGPDITGSNRANLDYILENIVDPSAVLGKDYRMTMISTENGRVISGLITKETESALTVRTLNDTVVVAKNQIEEQRLLTQSMMPERLLDSLSTEEVRDLIRYLASPAQVAIRGPRAPIDTVSGQVPGALEGETLKILAKTRGDARSQAMGRFKADRWSAGSHLWWTGAQLGDRLELEVPVKEDGTYRLELVATQAQDYGIVQISLNDQKLGAPLDLFNRPEVITSGVHTFENLKLKAGAHRLKIEIVGTNPRALPSFMFGLDYVRAVKIEPASLSGSEQ